MILFDPKAKTTSGAEAKKLNKKSRASANTKFSTSNNVSEAQPSHDLNEIADVAPMLFLQEINERKQDQEELEDFAKKAFKGLKELQLAVLNGQLDEQNLLNLQYALQKNHQFVTPELKELAEQIEIRIAVEIAKLERSRS